MWHTLLACLVALLLGLSAATQAFVYAHVLKGLTVLLAALSNPALGVPWWRESVLAFYAPWSIVVWSWRWGVRGSPPFVLAGVCGLTTAGLTLYQLWPRTTGKKGEAHFATRQDLQRAQCLPVTRWVRRGWWWVRQTEGTTGVVLGWWQGEILRYWGKWHLLVDASTQTGKTAAVVKPTLLDYQHSVIAFDPKEELYADTAGYRGTLGRVILLAPLRDETDQYNPWAMVRWGTPDEIRDIDIITEYLMRPAEETSQDSTSEHFERLMRLTFRGITLYGYYSKLGRTGAGQAMTGAEYNDLVNLTDWDDLMTVMKSDAHPAVRRAAVVATRPGEKELGSLQTTLANALDLFSDERVAHMTDRCTFTMQDLREKTRPCSVYVQIPFADHHRLVGLTRLIFQQMFDHCTSRYRGWPHPCLFIAEELPGLGRFRAVTRGLNHWAGYGLQFLGVTPSMEELTHVHGPHHSFIEGCRVQLAFGLNDEEVAYRLSKRIGTRTVTKTRVSTTRGRRTASTSDEEEALVSPTSVLQADEEAILLKVGRYTAWLEQARFYASREWLGRSRLPLPRRGV